MFRTIVVPLDLERDGDHALPLAGALAAEQGIPIELITVSSPRMPEAADRFQLAARTRQLGPNAHFTLLHDNDVAGLLVREISDRPNALTVMATRGRGALSRAHSSEASAKRCWPGSTVRCCSSARRSTGQTIRPSGPWSSGCPPTSGSERWPMPCRRGRPRSAGRRRGSSRSAHGTIAAAETARPRPLDRVERADRPRGDDQPRHRPQPPPSRSVGRVRRQRGPRRGRARQRAVDGLPPRPAGQCRPAPRPLRAAPDPRRAHGRQRRVVEPMTEQQGFAARASAPPSGESWAQVETMTRDECLCYLAATRLGRVAISVGALPAILPVRFVLDGDQIVFRAAPGKVLEAATREAVVAFEADGVERLGEPSVVWSVLVTGVARHLAPEHARAHEGAIALPAWSEDHGDHVVAISPQLVSGRRAR